MRLLADENCPGDLLGALIMRGHDVMWIRTSDPGISDRAVVARARDERRVVLTFDKDFGELIFRHRIPAPAGVILCRLSGLPPQRVVAVVLAALESQVDWTGRFGVVTEDRIRVVSMPGIGRGEVAPTDPA